jgi:trans-aconitate 2-methyltransferase
MSERHAHHGAKQPHIFSHERAEMLEEPEREGWLPTPVLVALLDVKPGMRVLDFGAGTGRYAIAIAQAHPDASVTAYDVQPEFLAMIDKRAHDAHVENLHTAGALDATYDRIFAVNVLHEVGDEDLRLMRAALAPGGTALIADWDAGIDRPTGPPREHAHTESEARTRLAAAGFTQIKTLQEPRLPYHYTLVLSI